MNSRTAADLDEIYDRLHWAGEEYIPEELNDEVGGLKKAGKTYYNEIMIANAEKMATVYLGFHTLDAEMAIDRLKESN